MASAAAALTVDLVVLTDPRRPTCRCCWSAAGIAPYQGRLGAARRLRAADEDLADRRRAGAGRGDRRAVASGPTSSSSRTYGAPRRDPRGRVVTRGLPGAAARTCPRRSPARDAADGRRGTPVAELLRCRPLAFDHAPDPGRRRSSGPGPSWSTRPLATAFCPTRVHHRRAAAGLRGGLGRRARPPQLPPQGHRDPRLRRADGGRTTRNGGRPAQLFTRGDADLLHPAMLRRREMRDSGIPRPRGDPEIPLSCDASGLAGPGPRSSPRPRWPGEPPGRCRSRTGGSGDRCASAPGCAPTSHPCGRR